MCAATFSLRSDCMCHVCECFVCVCALESERLCHTCRETVRLPVTQFSISCSPLRVKGDGDRRETHTIRTACDRLCVCVCACVACLRQRRREKNRQVCVPLSQVSYFAVPVQHRRWIGPSMSPFLTTSLNNPLRCSSLSFELDRQAKDRMEQ